MNRASERLPPHPLIQYFLTFPARHLHAHSQPQTSAVKSSDHFQLDIMVLLYVVQLPYKNHFHRRQIGNRFLERDGLLIRESEKNLIFAS